MKPTASFLSFLVLLSHGLISSTLGYEWPDPKFDAMEKLVFEGARADGDDLQSLLGDCFHRGGNRNKTTVAAQWLRFAYHDVATHNIEKGTGGIDGSIHFELDRGENIGEGMILTRQEYRSFHGKYVSRADVVAVGAVFSVVACKGPLIPMRMGRIDAEGPGERGVPEPQQDIQKHIDSFRLQGFTQTEMIELVACGHTLGVVESKDFPTIVRPPSGDPTVSRAEAFDNTAEFDTKVVTDYLEGTSVNPLVVGFNETTRSDLRIFNSDGNVTVRALADPSTFQERCKIMMQKMVDTVPSGVTLTEPMQPLEGKVYEAGYRFINGTLHFQAALRLAINGTAGAPIDKAVKMYFCDRNGDNADCKANTAKVITSGRNTRGRRSPMASRLGISFTVYHFLVALDSTVSMSDFWFEIVDDKAPTTVLKTFDNDGAKYTIDQDQIFLHDLASSISKEKLANGTELMKYNIVAGVRTDPAPSRVYVKAYDKTHLNASYVLDTTLDMTLNSSMPAAAGYSFYSAQLTTELTGTTFDLYADVGTETYALDYQVGTFFGQERYRIPLGSPETVPHTYVAKNKNTRQGAGSGGGDNSGASSLGGSKPQWVALGLAVAGLVAGQFM
ncbi:heme peroxidase [Panaeolus papilionaceus]|nr:heme peroxidase [Panaeolus papilionaceus]